MGVSVWDTRDAIKAAALAAGAYFVDVLEMPIDITVATPLSTTLAASASASATTISVAAPVPIQSTIQIGTGSTSERRVVTNVSGGGPHTVTVKALTSAHSSGEAVVQSVDRIGRERAESGRQRATVTATCSSAATARTQLRQDLTHCGMQVARLIA
jgi:hypothetical protein